MPVIELPEAHARALAAAGDLVAGVGPHQWDRPSIDDEWTVRELVNHLASGNWWVAPLVGGRTIDEVGDRYDGDVLGDDLVGAYDASAEVAAAAFLAPGAMDVPCAVSYGPVPGSVYCGHRLLEGVVHGWDVARSTDQDATLAPDLVETCWGVVEPQLDDLRASGMFGPAVVIGGDADAQTVLLAALGRRV